MSKKASKEEVKIASKGEWAKWIAEKLDITQARAKEFLDQLAERVEFEVCKNGTAILPGICKVWRSTTNARPARVGVNPFTREKQEYPAKPAGTKIKIKPSKNLRDLK